MSELQPDSFQAFERLISEQSSYLNEVDQQIAKWAQFQDDYRHLRTRLSTLPDRLTHDCMVPFGKLAFIPGRVVHSNEILVLLGENYFVERSCKQAIDIVDRRLGNIEENLQKHHQEKEMFQKQKKYTGDFLDDRTKFIEIKETDEPSATSASLNRRAKLTDEQIREERRRLQERALKLTEKKTKQVHFADEQMDVDSDDDVDGDDETPHQQMKKIAITHTPITSAPLGDASPALFSHPGAIGKQPPMAFTGRTVERELPTPPIEPPAKRMSKFRASRQ